jgi:plastocyanin
LRPVVLAVPIAALVLIPATAPAAAPKTVEIGDNYMIEDAGVPKLKVKPGTKVTFVWTGKRRHNVTAGNPAPGKFGSPTQRRGTWSHRFKRAGTFDLVCTIHGAGDMGMKVVVR